MSTWMLGKTLYLHSIHCVDGCQDCRDRTMTKQELQELRERGEIGAHGPLPRVLLPPDEPDPED